MVANGVSPYRFNHQVHPISGKTLRNVYITFRSFFGRINKQFNLSNTTLGVATPRFQKAPVQVFEREEVAELIKACQFTRQAETNFRQSFKMRRPSAFRDEAIILTLLIPGCVHTELCALTLADLDLKAGKFQVRHGVMGGAKGGKGRQVYIGKITRKTIWRYLASRGTTENPDAPLFIWNLGSPFNRDSLRQLLGA